MSINKTNFFNNALVALRLKNPEEEKSYSGKLYSKLNNLVNKAALTNNRFLDAALKSVAVFALIAPATVATLVTALLDGIVAIKNGVKSLLNKITKKPEPSIFKKAANFVTNHKLAFALGIGLIGLGTGGYIYADKVRAYAASFKSEKQ